jgi:hypothetical protein
VGAECSAYVSGAGGATILLSLFATGGSEDAMEPRYRRVRVVLLAAAVGVLAVATGLFAALYEGEQGDVGRLKGQIAAADQSIAGTQEQSARVASSLAGLDAAWSRLEATNKQLHACADPAKDMVIAANDNDSAAGELAAHKVAAECGR